MRIGIFGKDFSMACEVTRLETRLSDRNTIDVVTVAKPDITLKFDDPKLIQLFMAHIVGEGYINLDYREQDKVWNDRTWDVTAETLGLIMK